MRSELEQLEQIDQYLGGEMNADQAAAFEAQLKSDPKLNSLFEDQQLLIQTVSRQALMAEINSVAGIGGAAAGASWGLVQWIITGLGVIGVTVGGVFIYNNYGSNDADDTSTSVAQEEIANESDSNNPGLKVDTGTFIAFEMNEEVDSVYDDYDNYTPENSYTGVGENDVIENDLRNEHNNRELTNVNNTQQGNDKKEGNKAPTSSSSNKVDANRKACFPGGDKKMKQFFKKKLMYPRTPKDKGLQGTVKVSFLVTADGNITELESDCFVMKDENGKPLSSGRVISNSKSKKYFEEQAERVFRISSPWTPATDSHGNPVLSLQTWYVNYNLYGESEIYQLDGVESTSSCNLTSEKDWENVEVRLLNVKKQPKGFIQSGDGLVKTSKKINNVDDLTSKQYQEICKNAARNNSCVVFIDVNEFWAKQNGRLYYYYGSFSE
jgi:hypothetical protein